MDLQTLPINSAAPGGSKTYWLGTEEQDRLMIDDNELGLGHICWSSIAFIIPTLSTFFLELCTLLCLLKMFSV